MISTFSIYIIFIYIHFIKIFHYLLFPFYFLLYRLFLFFFFFQAEDGIRDGTVTGVQTCALPISQILLLDEPAAGMNPQESQWLMQVIQRVRKEFELSVLLIEHDMRVVMGICERRSEERRVGKECRSRWSADQ